MSSMASTRPRGPAASVAVRWWCASWTAATTMASPVPGVSALRASRVFTTWASPSSPSGGSTRMAFAVCGLTLARTAGSVVQPLRQTMLVVPVARRRAPISSSISALSLEARTVTVDRR